MVLMLIARVFVLMTLSLFLVSSSSCVNGTVTDPKRSCRDGLVPDRSCFLSCANVLDIDRSIVARSRSGFTVIVDESALGCATGTVTDCTRFCANDIVPVSWLQQQLC